MTTLENRAVFSIDVEDWYHGVELPYSEWAGKEDRIRIGLDSLLELLRQSKTQGTFFILGWIAEKNPELVRKIASLGHEIGSHGYNHRRVTRQTPDEFRSDIRRTKGILEELSGRPVLAHRSPFFSIVKSSLWALPILSEEGYKYDCSIAPVKNWHYGIENSPDHVYQIRELGLIEFPISTSKILGRKAGIGGAYFRIFPYWWTRSGISRLLKASHPVMFYAHPWEYDPGHPSIGMDFRIRLTHYSNLKSTYEKTQRLLQDYRFDTLSNVVKNIQTTSGIPVVSLESLKN